MKPAPDGDVTPDRACRPRCWAALGITGVATLVLGVLPGLVLRFGDLQTSPVPSARDELARRDRGRGWRDLDRVRATLALYGADGLLHRPAAAPGAAATSSPRRRSGRCSAPCWPARSTPGGQRLGRPRAVHRRRRRCRPGHAGPSGAGGPPGRARERRARLRRASRCRRRSAPATPTGCASVAALPDGPITGVVLANELLDNLPFRLMVIDGGWREAFVAPTATVRSRGAGRAVRRMPRRRSAGRRAARCPGAVPGARPRRGSPTRSIASARGAGSC